MKGEREMKAALDEVEGAGWASVHRGASLSDIARWRIGGTCFALVRPRGVESAKRVVELMSYHRVPFLVIGDATNLLFDSSGLDCVVVQLVSSGGSEVWVRGKQLTAMGSASSRHVAEVAGAHSLTGVEHIFGIPGTIGGLVAMNGGTMRQAIGDAVVSVDFVSKSGQLRTLVREQCAFARRSSLFQDGDKLITAVHLNLDRGDAGRVSAVHAEIERSRAARFPESSSNCGSTFVSDPEVYHEYGAPGALIESVGMKGFRLRDVEVSTEHANFINNVGSASSDDVLEVIGRIRSRVAEKTGHWMRAEVKFVRRDGVMMPAHKALKGGPEFSERQGL